MRFDEALDLGGNNGSKFHIRESGSDTVIVTLSNNMIIKNGSNYVEFKHSVLHGKFVHIADPRLDIDSGAVRDKSGNPNAAVTNLDITKYDYSKPTFDSASYTTGTGMLTVRLSEALDSSKHVATKFHIRESGQSSGGVTLSNGTITTNGTSSVTFTLSNSDKSTVNSMATPQLDVDAGAVSDSAGNAISAAADQAITVNDTIRPTFVSATYSTGEGTLSVTFSEALDATTHDASKMHIRNTGQSAGGVTLSNGMITTNGTSSITFDLSDEDTGTVNSMTTPQIDIEAGAVRDASGNTISAASDQTITVRRVSPAITSASYHTANGTLAVAFSADLAFHNSSRLVLGGQGNNTLAPPGDLFAEDGGTLTAVLNGTLRSSFEDLAHPRYVAALPHAVTDTKNNSNTARLAYPVAYDDDTPPSAVRATYDFTRGSILLTLSERTLLNHTASITLYGGQESVRLHNATATTAGANVTIPLEPNAKSRFDVLQTPRQVGLSAGSLADIWGNAAGPVRISMSDEPPPPALQPNSSYTAFDSTLLLVFNEEISEVHHARMALTDGSSRVGFGPGQLHMYQNTVTAALNATQSSAVGGFGMLMLEVERGAVLSKRGGAMAADTHSIQVILGGPELFRGPVTWQPPASGPAHAVRVESSPAPPRWFVVESDTTPPSLRSAAYDPATSGLSLMFDEAIDADLMDMSGLVLNRDNRTLPLGGAEVRLNPGSRTLLATLEAPGRAMASSGSAHVLVLGGAVSDVAGNGAAAGVVPVAVADSRMPVCNGAKYTPEMSTLLVAFDNDIRDVRADRFHIWDRHPNGTGITLDGDDMVAVLGDSSLLFAMDEQAQESIGAMTVPRLGMEMGAVRATEGFMSMDMEVPVTTSPMPGAVPAPGPAVYSTLADAIWLDVDNPGRELSVDARQMVLRNDTYLFHLEHDPPPRGGASPGGAYEPASHPGGVRLEVSSPEVPFGSLALDIMGGAISNEYGNSTFASVPVRVFEGITAGFSDPTATGLPNMTDVRTVAAEGRVWLLAISTGISGGMAVLDATDPGDMDVAFFAPMEGTVGMDTISAGGVPYAAVLTGAGLAIYDITQPAFPEEVGFFGMLSDWMFLTAAELAGVPHLILQDSKRFKILDLSNPANPVLVTSARLLYNAPYLGMEAFYDGARQYAAGSLARGLVCITDMSDPLEPVGECRAESPSTADTRDVGVLSGGGTLVLAVADGRTPGMIVYNATGGTLEMVSFVPMPHHLPLRVEALELYGTPYALVLAPHQNATGNDLLVYDLSDAADPALAMAERVPPGTDMYVDVAGDSARLLLVDASGTIRPVLLSGTR